MSAYFYQRHMLEDSADAKPLSHSASHYYLPDHTLSVAATHTRGVVPRLSVKLSGTCSLHFEFQGEKNISSNFNL